LVALETTVDKLNQAGTRVILTDIQPSRSAPWRRQTSPGDMIEVRTDITAGEVLASLRAD